MGHGAYVLRGSVLCFRFNTQIPYYCFKNPPSIQVLGLKQVGLSAVYVCVSVCTLHLCLVLHV